MGKLTDKTVANTHKDLLHLNNSNSGVDTSGTTIQDGDGANTMLTLGTRLTKIQPTVAPHVTSFAVNTVAGANILSVDTLNNLVKVNETQSIANTQYLRFSANDIDVDSGTHIGVPVAGQEANAVVTFGTGTDPAVNTFSLTADDMIHYIHYVDTNITVDSVQVLVGATTASGDALNFHLVSLATSSATTISSWSGITVVADDSGTTSAGYEQFYRVSLTVQAADVDAGDYLALTIEGDGTSSDYSVNALVRYHLR